MAEFWSKMLTQPLSQWLNVLNVGKKPHLHQLEGNCAGILAGSQQRDFDWGNGCEGE
jgi:hypothetical protein